MTTRNRQCERIKVSTESGKGNGHNLSITRFNGEVTPRTVLRVFAIIPRASSCGSRHFAPLNYFLLAVRNLSITVGPKLFFSRTQPTLMCQPIISFPPRPNRGRLDGSFLFLVANVIELTDQCARASLGFDDGRCRRTWRCRAGLRKIAATNAGESDSDG